MNSLSIDVRTGLRAAVAVALASGVAHIFALGRSYWVILVAVVVLAETWGTSIQRSVQRVAATAAGCVVGWAVQRVAGESQWVQVVIMFICIFFAIYFRGYSYPWMMFFITVYVVFLFALLGEWDTSIAILRLKDTIAGGAVALAATVVVPPAAANQLRSDLIALWKCAQAQLAASLAAIAPLEHRGEGVEECRDNLYQTVEMLRAHIAVSPYENILRPLAVRHIREIVERTEALGRHVLVLAEIVQLASRERLRPLEPQLRDTAEEAMSTVHGLASDSAADTASSLPAACERLERRAGELSRAGEIGAGERLTICSVAYHLTEIGRCVSRIVELRRKLPATAGVPAARDVAVPS